MRGAVLPVDGSPTVAAAFDAWDAKPCDVDRSNAVVRAIDDVIDGYKVGTAGWASLQNIVIVGDGTIIPHAALPDGTTDTSERDFLSEALTAGSGQIAGAAGRSMFLSDAPYGTFTPLSIQGQIAYIPQVALGRLGGSGDTVGQAIDRFLAAGGVADPGTASKTAFESDYDFFTDAGAATTATLTGLGYAVNRLTVTDALAPWSVAQFVSGLLPAGGAARVLAINAHFDPSRMLAASGLDSRCRDGSVHDGRPGRITARQHAPAGGLQHRLPLRARRARLPRPLRTRLAGDLPGEGIRGDDRQPRIRHRRHARRSASANG